VGNASSQDAVTVSMDGLSHGVQEVLPLGEELERCVRVYARTVSHSERQRLWDQEHERVDALWRLSEHQEALERFRERCESERSRRRRSDVL